MQLSIILVHYKTKALSLQCLRSVVEHVKGLAYEIILVDNDSGDGMEDVLKSEFPQVRYHNTGYNAGFSRANNAGMNLATAPFYLLLNTDCLISDDSIQKCWERLQLHSNAVAAGVQLCDAAGNVQQSAHYFVKGGLNFLLPLPVWGKWLQKMAKRFTKIKTHPETTNSIPVEVDWVSGAFMMVKKEAIEKAGPMDEDFFLYGEEVEWFSRLRKVGKVLFFPDLKCVHLEGGSGTETHESYIDYSSIKGRQLLLSNLLSVRKRYGVGWFMLHWMLVNIAYFTVLFDSGKHSGFLGNVRKLQGWFISVLFNKRKFYKVI